LKKTRFSRTFVADGHLCCGSAGSYSSTPADARQSKNLRDNRMNALEAGKAKTPSSTAKHRLPDPSWARADKETPVRPLDRKWSEERQLTLEYWRILMLANPYVTLGRSQ